MRACADRSQPQDVGVMVESLYFTLRLRRRRGEGERTILESAVAKA